MIQIGWDWKKNYQLVSISEKLIVGFKVVMDKLVQIHYNTFLELLSISNPKVVQVHKAPANVGSGEDKMQPYAQARGCSQ